MCSYAYIMLDQTQIDLNRYFISPAKVYQVHIFFIYKGYGFLLDTWLTVILYVFSTNTMRIT